ncbi:MAG: non-specific endonuclease, partial [Verrucomicrobiales bacterium]|nr:non-specific endonuclease [Verrucomicrobiales bacterium]
MRRRLLKTFNLLAFSFIAVAQVHAAIDASLQMQLGNPSNATADTNNHSHYLIQRPVEALDYNDSLGQPNWASWDLTASDLGTNSRSGTFFTDTNLPPNFYRVTSGDYTHSDYDRGHMCPSGDRTDTEANNDMVFLMSNMVPQNSLNNSGVWGQFETYCRTLTTSNELLIICGPSGFGSDRINTNGPAYIPAYVWKVAVVVPSGAGTALSRVTNSTRVIALKIPNSNAATNNWPAYVTSASQIEVDTGFTFFTALPNTLASVLRNKVDGQTNPPPVIFGFSPMIGAPNTNVVITGTNFASASAVTFGPVSAASFNVDSGTQISAVVPTNAGTGFISVTTPSGTAISSNSFAIIGGGVYTGTLIGWDVSPLTGGAANYGTSPLTPTTNAPNLSVVGLTRGSGIGTGGTAAAQAWGGVNFTNSTANIAITSNKFVTFHVAANTGYKVSFSSISRFDYRRSATGPSSGVLQYQIGSGAFTDITNLSYSVTSSSGGSIGAINLSEISALQNVEVGTNVVFRIVNYGGTDIGGTWYIFDAANSTAFDLAVLGTVTPVDISPPGIVANPASRTNLATTTATFTVGADGATPLTYAWKKDGVNLSDGGNISGATNATLTITMVLASDVANYSCYITNANGWTNSSSAALVVLDPAILTQPLNQTNIQGATATFVSSAGGTASLAYQWKREGTNLTDVGNIVGSATATLTVSNVSSNDVGNYSLVVTNSLGSITSSTVSLTVLIPPTITAQPVTRTNNTGTTATFTVAASGTQPLAYRWKKNGVNLTDTGTVTGSTTAALTISNVQAANGGIYSAVVTNSAGSATSSDATLEIATAQGEIVLSGSSYTQNFDSMGTGTNLPAGWLMTAPGTAAPTYGSSANFSNVNLTASSGGPTTGGRYSWAPTTNTSDRAVGVMTSGTYASPNSIMSGFYNGTGSNIVALTLSFDIERYRINSSAASNTFFLSYDGTNWISYTTGDSGAFSTGTTTHTFTGGTVVSKSFALSGLSITNNGRFYLRWNLGTVGSNSQGLGLDNVVLEATLANPPVITANPSSQTVDPGTAVNFTVSVTGSEPLNYRWSKGGIPLNDGGNISGSSTVTLTVGSVGLSDVATYDVVITNFMGSVTSAGATLTLTNGAVVTENPISRTNISGTSVTFAVSASGANPLIYQWRKDTINLTNGGTIFGANSDSLTVTSLAPNDAGSYSVVVTNGAASALSATATLTVLVPPTITQQPVSSTNRVGDNVSFNVTATSPLALSYQWFHGGVDLGVNSSTLSLTGITSADVGTYSVVVANIAGTATSASAALHIVPFVTTQPIAQTNTYGDASATFSVSASGEGTLSYQWKKDGGNITGATNTSYTITNPAVADSALYSVRINNDYGFVDSDAVSLVVNKKLLTVTAEDKSKVYGNANPEFTVSYAGFITGDSTASLTTLPTATSTATSSTGIGSQAITASGGAAANYSFSYVEGSLTITVRPITVTADAKNKAFGQTDPTLTYQVTTGSLAGTDAFAGALTRAPGEEPASYAIQQGSLTAGGNYNLTFVSANLTIAGSVPTIVSEAVSRTNNVLSLATFDVTATGGGLGYQWVKTTIVTNITKVGLISTTNVVTNVLAVSNGANITGATGASLSILSVVHTNEGSYTVVVTNSVGAVTSAPVVLKVLEPFIT